ncbi:MAG: TetR/AcrR family transcriptional regulator [Eggerthellales bacterium]|nr:TetR/AcrR family transcriptional regulator [Eggerthellales bacterium]
MARPKKNSGTVEAKQRISDAYWKLLETNRYDQITVGMVVEEAKCNRGTFYYHYENLEDLVDKMLEQCILSDNALSDTILALLSNINLRQTLTMNKERFSHIALMIRQGGMEKVYVKFRELTLRMWTEFLCEPGEKLKPEAQMIIEFFANGAAGVCSHLENERYELDVDEALKSRFLIDAPRFCLQEVCQAQGVGKEEILRKALAMKACLDRN